MPLPTWIRTFIVVSLAVVPGCATAHNYSDPSGPVIVGAHSSAVRSSDEIRVVTWNLKFGEHIDRAGDLLSRPGPLADSDVLVLQEMDGTGTETLARDLGLNYVYVPSAIHPSTHRDFGVAVLSPWPLEDARKILLPHHHRFRKLRRAAAAVTIVSPVGRLQVYAVHLETPFGAWSRARRDQARTILADAKDSTGPVVVAGDFNGRSGAEELSTAGFLWLTRSVHDGALFFDFDHILARGLCAAGESAAGVARDDVHASDHRPVWARLRSCP